MASSLPTRCSGAKVTLICIPLCLLRILSNDDDAKQQLYTYITLLNSFSWRPPHDYAVKKPPNATFYEGREHKTIIFFLLLLSLDKVLRNSTPGEIAYIWQMGRVQIDTLKVIIKRKFILSATFSLSWSLSLLKLPNFYNSLLDPDKALYFPQKHFLKSLSNSFNKWWVCLF